MKLLFTIAILLSAIQAMACTCVPLPEFKTQDDLRSYDFIALVKVTGLAPVTRFGRENGDIKIEVKELLKGQTTTLATDPSYNTSCAMSLKVGEEWLFFGTIRNGKMQAITREFTEVWMAGVIGGALEV